MTYNARFGVKDLFMNPSLSGVFPQFKRGTAVRDSYSFDETEEKVQSYIAGVLNAAVTSKGELSVKGKHETILRRVRQLQPLIEALFNNMPTLARSIKSNAKLYMPFVTVRQMQGLTSYGKMRAIKAVLENMQYNPDFQSDTPGIRPPTFYVKRQDAWKKKVGYRE